MRLSEKVIKQSVGFYTSTAPLGSDASPIRVHNEQYLFLHPADFHLRRIRDLLQQLLPRIADYMKASGDRNGRSDPRLTSSS